MKITWDFSIYPPATTGGRNSVYLSSTAYAKLKPLLVPSRSPLKSHPDFALNVLEEEDSPILAEILRVIFDETGRTPLASEYPTAEERDSPKQFRVLRRRHYDKADVAECEFLQWSAMWAVAPWLAHLCGQEDEKLIIDKFFGRKADVGWLQANSEPVVSGELKSILEKQGFLGLTFREIRTSTGMPLNRTLWQPWSTVEMPPTQLPKVKPSGGPYDGNIATGMVFEDGAEPAELKFHRSEIKKLSTFDFAITQERRGGNALLAFRHYIVTQGFRHVILDLQKNAKKLGLVMPATAFIPVRLI